MEKMEKVLELISCTNSCMMEDPPNCTKSCCNVIIQFAKGLIVPLQKVLNYEQRIKSPILWIGNYVALASLACALAMAADVFYGFRHRKPWFPCKFFTLNAASLTLLAVAMKLPLDLSSEMPGVVDQLAKLSGTALMATTVANFMPSLGGMDDREIFMNITALAILVITIFVNVCIQLGTQVINQLCRIEHIVVLSSMLVLLVLLCSSALTVSTTKKNIKSKYGDMEKMTSTEGFTVEKLKEDVKKYSMMAETGSPQFVIARSVTCSASGAFCLLTLITLAEVEVRALLKIYILLKHAHIDFKIANTVYLIGSDYKSATFIIVVFQSVGVIVGTIGPIFRWFTAIRLKFLEKRVKSYNTELKIESYWIERLARWRESPLALRVRGKRSRKLVHTAKNLVLDYCMGVQIGIVTASKLIQLVSVFLIIKLLSFGQRLISKYIAPNNHTRSESGHGTMMDLSKYVLHLEGEEELPLQMMKYKRDATNHFIQKGKKQQPKYLKELLDKSTTFVGVAKFDSDRVPSLNSEEPPNCWSLPVVTLTSIAIALPKNDNHKVKWLLQSVREGLLYVNLVEKILDAKGDLVSISSAADVVWLEVDLFCRWLDEDLRKIALEGKNSKDALERLADIAKNHVIEFEAMINEDLKENPLNWPIKAIAANSMYRICQTVMLDCDGNNDRTDERLFEQLCVMIADILGACLTNLPLAITMKCFCSAMEEREKHVQHAAQLLGETEEILNILQQRELPGLNPDKMAHIDEWRTLIKQKNSLGLTSSSSDGTSSDSNELLITVE
ncbi:uncharacterized protein LOC132305438 [Cornus florida]|uniref:uncharacterized protein LOC132305438 n=1 Tax=Cornus florida TaxID=4283 RepID=UPI00289FE1D5|nr:uncharacterized protein LOC132305438 [Cornus florida]